MCEDVSNPFDLILLGDFMMKLANASLALSTATFGLMLGVAQNAQAASFYRIPNVTVSSLTGTTTNNNYSTLDMLNGKGLPLDKPSLAGSHAGTNIGNAWRSNSTTVNPVTGNLNNSIGITFNLNGYRSLAGFSFWNATGGPNQNVAGFGVKNVTFEYSNDNGANFTPLAPTAFNGGAWTGAFTQGGTSPQLVDFQTVGATHVRFNIASNYGGNRVAINEVQFKAIPEPSASLALLGLGLAGVGLRKRI
jgi:hypothetical protein